MTAPLVIAILASGLAGVFLAPFLAGRPGIRAHCTSFAAGVLLAVVLSHVIPETLKSAEKAHEHFGGAIILAGFMAMMFLQQKVLKADPCCGHEHAKHAGLPSYLALVACSINDGMILADNPSYREPLFWAMCGHKITACFALVMLLRETSAGLSNAMRNLYMLIFVLITPVVVLLAAQLKFMEGYMHYPVGIGAGALLYVICGGMIPRVEHSAQDGRKWVLGAFLLGVLSMIAIELVAPHDH